MINFGQIHIIDPKALSEKAFITVDKFEAYAKALSLADTKRPIESTLSAAFAIMKLLADTPKGIMNKLEKFTLDIADMCFQTLGQGPSNFKDPVVLSKKQEMALTVEKSIKPSRVSEIEKINWMLFPKLKSHEKCLETLISMQETQSTVAGKIEDNLDTYSVVFGKLRSPKEPLCQILHRMHGLQARFRMLKEKNQDTREKITKRLDMEMAIKSEIVQISHDIYHFTKKLLKKKFEAGLEHLRKVMKAVVPNERVSTFEEILSSILPDDEADNMITASSKVYIYPNVNLILKKNPYTVNIPHCTYAYPDVYFSSCYCEERPIQHITRRLPYKATKVLVSPTSSRNWDINHNCARKEEGQAVQGRQSSVVHTGLAFGWTPVNRGLRKGEKKWLFFRPNSY